GEEGVADHDGEEGEDEEVVELEPVPDDDRDDSLARELRAGQGRDCTAGTRETGTVARTQKQTDAVLRELRKVGLAYPGTHTKSPWPGHLDLAVNDKTFAYLSLEGEPLGISCKLPRSAALALALPFVEPAGYGLGKSGWVAAELANDQD